MASSPWAGGRTPGRGRRSWSSRWRLGTVTFAALGLLLAGTLRAEATLALANGLFIAALLVGGIIVPTSALPAPLATVADLLPVAALAEALRVALGGTATWPARSCSAGPFAVLASVRWSAGIDLAPPTRTVRAVNVRPD